MRIAGLTLIVLLSGVQLRAQSPLPGFSAAAAAKERALETMLQGVPDSAQAGRDVRTLSAVPHVAGTPAQQATAAYVLREMRAAGLDTSRLNFQVWMPYPDSTIVEIVTPERKRLTLEEPPLAEDPTTQQRPWPAMNGTAGSGDVTAPVVYVNYGLADDYAALDSLHVDVRGKVVLARYGRSFRGIKAREAEKRGAAALLLYSDPQDDGFFRGDVYPAGPMRNPDGVQRGSVFNGDGDPTTPGWPSTAGARRLPLDSMPVSHIPVVPLGYRNAALILAPMRGPGLPAQGWQGGLPFRYHVGGEGVTVRVGLWHQTGDRAYKTITNTFGVLRGSRWPDEIVLIGAHRDAWGPGARDNVGGVTSVLGAARAWGAAARAGHRPLRTLVFATWDAEEWGLVGSTEYAELMQDSLRARAVAYVNQDDAADGRQFGAGGTASLHGLLRDVSRTIQQPGDTVSVYAAWFRRRAPGDTGDVRLGDLGGGSDFGGFYNFLGIPSVEYGFGGPGGGYHSAYDTYTLQDRFGDPGFLSAAAVGRVSAVVLARLANAEIVPFDDAELARRLAGLSSALAASPAAKRAGIRLDSLDAAIAALRTAGAAFNAARDSALAGRAAAPAKLARVNAILRGVEQEMVRPTGLVGRPRMRNLVIASDRDNGYSDMPFPGVGEALRDGDAAQAQREVAELASRVNAAAARVDRATAALR
ncbi:MAG: M20/M25/M40 family metallo-hydrolase [Bacillota bacterium]